MEHGFKYGLSVPLIPLVEMTEKMKASTGPGPARLFSPFCHLIASEDAPMVSDEPTVVLRVASNSGA